MTRPGITLVFALAFAVTTFAGQSLASAEIRSSSISVEPEADGIVVRIDNMQVEHNTLETRGDRIYIDLPGAAAAQQLRLQGDATVKLVEIRDGRHPRISVKMRHGREKTRALGMAATIANLDGGIIMHIPRWPLPREVAVAVAPKEVPPVSAKIESAQPNEPAANDVEPGAAESTPVAGTVAAVGTQAPTPTPTATPTTEASTVPSKSSEGGVSFGLLFGVLLLLAGGGIIVWRSKQTSKDAVDLESFRVIATKQLGGKSKVVWLSVGDREMVVSVGEAGTQLLSEWSRNQQPALAAAPMMNPTAVFDSPPAALSIASKQAEMRERFAVGTPAPLPSTSNTEVTASTLYDFRSTLSTAAKAQADIASHLGTRRAPATKKHNAPRGTSSTEAENSPSVAGLLKLRDQVPKVNVEVATDDQEADAEWARELFKATRESVLRRMD
ncbi:MAG: flagellar biosynthetic protein FliO [Myxococcales bacterium]|nr:flagellar biosynthetic protein FliO [Myxococcales bacterium]